MIWLDLAQNFSDPAAVVSLASAAGETWHQASSHLPHNFLDWQIDIDILAQRFDTDPFRGTREAIGNFFESGQAWACLAGIVIGFTLSKLTSYG